MAAAGPSTTRTPLMTDPEVADPPTDSVSKIAFSPIDNALAVASWDNSVRAWRELSSARATQAPSSSTNVQVRLYAINDACQSQGIAMYAHEAPVLDLCWTRDGSFLFSAAADGSVYAFSRQEGRAQPLLNHQAPIKCIRYVEVGTNPILITAGYDLKMKYWDLQGGSLMGEVELRTKPCAMDASNLFVILGLFDGTVSVYDLENPYAIAREFDFHHEPRVVTLLPERRSALGLNSRPSVFFAVGRMDGRVSIQAARAAHAAEKAGDSASFNFQAHRVPVTEEYPLPPAVDAGAVRMGRVFHITPVNAVAAHPNGSVCTGGGDGSLAFWDIRGKQRLKVWTAEDFGNGAPNVKVPGTMPVWGVPVVAVAYNFSGTVAAYAFSYDWSKGHMGVPVGVNATRIMLHPLLPEEMSKV